MVVGLLLLLALGLLLGLALRRRRSVISSVFKSKKAWRKCSLASMDFCRRCLELGLQFLLRAQARHDKGRKIAPRL